MVSSLITSILIPLLSVTVAVLGLWYNAHLNKKSQELSALKAFDSEIRSIELEPSRSERYDQWGVDFLDELNKIAYLRNKRIIGRPTAMYFREEFSSALGILALETFKGCRGRFRDLEDFCKDAKIAVGKAPQTYEEYTKSKEKPCE
jgi:hypothetical protein